MAANLSALFLAALAATTLMRIWLGMRHIAHVTRHRGAVPAAFADVIRLDAHQKAADYTVARTRLGLVDTAIDAAFLAALTLGGGLQWLFDLTARFFTAGGYAHGLAFIGALSLLSFFVGLPFSLYRTFVIEERFGFNRMTVGLYVLDHLKVTALTVAIGGPLLLLVLWLMDHMGALWWLYVWAVWVAFMLFSQIIGPTFIAPLFNKFTPLADADLKQRIEALLARCGFRSSGIFVMDGSQRSAHGNAYFTGFGAAKRIVFFDTLISRLAPQEIEAVLAHELGHFKHRHVWKLLGAFIVASLGFLCLLGYLIEQPWFFHGLGMRSTGTAPALMLFMLVIPVFLFPLSPLLSRWSRKNEYEADAYAASQAARGDLVSALVKLFSDNAATLTPDPIYSSFYDSHPPAALRIARLQAATSGAGAPATLTA